MKNKNLTYVLIAAVTCVWGLILYRIFAAVGDSGDSAMINTTKPVKEAYNDYAIPKDTTKLFLNYRDPFGLVKQKDTTMKVARVNLSKNIPVVVKPSINWSFITYSGYIRNPSSKKLIALMSINGQNTTMSEGETKNHVKLLKNLKDSIKISYAGKTKFIAIRSATL